MVGMILPEEEGTVDLNYWIGQKRDSSASINSSAMPESIRLQSRAYPIVTIVCRYLTFRIISLLDNSPTNQLVVSQVAADWSTRRLVNSPTAFLGRLPYWLTHKTEILVKFRAHDVTSVIPDTVNCIKTVRSGLGSVYKYSVIFLWVTVQISSATRDLMLIQHNKFY